MDRPRLFLIDGHSYIYRAFFAIRNLSTSKGKPTNAIYGFATMLLKIIREHRPSHLAVAFDTKGPTLRHEVFEDYKAQRPEMPDALQEQIPPIHRLVEALQIPALFLEGYEADDLIGSLAHQAEQKGMEVTIVSGDKDMFQLITPAVSVYDTMKEKVYRVADVHKRWGVEPKQVIEVMGLMGDTVDNIPGVPGIGGKTATRLIQRFGSVENLLERVEEIEKPKIREKLQTYSEQARMSRKLAEIMKDCPVRLDLDSFRRCEPDKKILLPLLQELEFTSLLKQFEAQPKTHMTRVEILDSKTSLNKMVRQCRSAGTFCATFWTLPPTEGLQSILGVSIAVSDQVVYIPLGHNNPGRRPQLETQQVYDHLRPLLEDIAVRKVGHDLKSTMFAPIIKNLTVQGPVADTMVASYLLNPNRRDHSLLTVALDRLGVQVPEVPSALTADIPLEEMAKWTGVYTSTALHLDSHLMPLLREQGLSHLFEDIEMPLVEVLAEMESTGFRLNIEALKIISTEIESQLSLVSARIQTLAGGPFNLNSPKQLAEILFNKLGLKPIKKTKTGYSTNEEVLQQLALDHELPSEILSYRQLTKLKSTYVDALPALVNPSTGRLHTSLNQCVTATGRLSSSNPNLQNIPVKGEIGQRIRGAFIAADGFRLLSADYSQIELRILAHLSQDKNLLLAFQQDEDVHTTTATQIFGLRPEQITSEMRRTAKTVNFGIVYGISAYGLSSTLKIPQAEAKGYIERYLDHYSGVRRFMEDTIAAAHEKGYVTTLFSRRRAIPELASTTPAVRGLGERAAINTPIQGSAADLIKIAMIRIVHRLKKEEHRSRILLQVHDELIFEVPDDEIADMKWLVRGEMEGVTPLSVPLKVDIGVGNNWSEAHP